MDLKKFQQRVETRETNITPTPDTCRNCPSLAAVRARSGQIVLSCLLERSDSQMDGPRDPKAKKGATAAWIRHALFTPKGELVNKPGADMGAVDFRKAAEAANETCPTMERLEGWLPSAPPDAIADLTPPAPILVYADVRVAIGLDGPKE
jgi:hypothetical protein